MLSLVSLLSIISSSFVLYYGFLPCSFICCMFLCLFILFNLLCLLSLFHRLQGHSSSYLWSLIIVGEIGPMPCEDFLVQGWCLCSGGWNWILCLWKAMLHLVVCFGGDCELVWFWAPCLLMNRIVGLFYYLFGVLCVALESASLWVGLVLVPGCIGS